MIGLGQGSFFLMLHKCPFVLKRVFLILSSALLILGHCLIGKGFMNLGFAGASQLPYIYLTAKPDKF